MKTTIVVPLALLTCSVALSPKKGERRWKRTREIERYRQYGKMKHAKKRHHRIMKLKWNEEKKSALGRLMGGEGNGKEEPYDPAAYGYAEDDSEGDRHLAAAGQSGVCPTEFVTCENGYATYIGDNATVGNVTCQEACGGECCVGNGTLNGEPVNSCTRFTGRVCKDGMSCSDNRTEGFGIGYACYKANITEVVNGCVGYRACEIAGYNGGHIGRVVNSCYEGDFSCFNAAFSGFIGEIVDLCKGYGSCRSTARSGGNISSIKGSCVGEGSCYGAADGGADGGAESRGDFIGYIYHGCGQQNACRKAAIGRSISGISYACNNVSACEYLASNSYVIGDGNLNFDSINSTIVSCCNEPSECTGSIVNASGLPAQCGPTLSPTSSPTTEPTGSPITASPSSSPTEGPVTSSPSNPPTVGPTVSPTARLKGSERSRAVLTTKSGLGRRLAEFPEASDECVKAAEDTTKELVEACLEPPNERVSSVSTVGVLRSDDEEVQSFTQNVTIEREVAESFDDLSECINKSVTNNNATDTLRSNAEKSGCAELEEGTVEGLTFVTEADADANAPTSTPTSPSESSDVSSSPTGTPTSPGEPFDVSASPTNAPSSSDEPSDVSASPTGTPTSLDEPSDVSTVSGKSGKSSSVVPSVSKASKKSEASSKASKSVSVKSAKAEPQEIAKLDEVEDEEESVNIDEVEEPEVIIVVDVEEDPKEYSEDEDEEEGFFDMIAKMLSGLW